MNNKENAVNNIKEQFDIVQREFDVVKDFVNTQKIEDLDEDYLRRLYFALTNMNYALIEL